MKNIFSSRLSFYGIAASVVGLFILSLPPTPSSTPEDALIFSPVKRYEGPSLTWEKNKVRRGDTFATLMQDCDFSPAEVNRMVRETKPVFNLARLRAGTECSSARDEEGTLREWRYEFDPEKTFVLRFPEAGGMQSGIRHHPFERRMEGVRARIEDSLYRALSPGGTRSTLPLQVADMFGWSVDFYYDLRKGDTVEVIYEQLYRDGEAYGTGRVMAATLVLSGKKLQSYFYRNGEVMGYYDAQGHSMKKQFLRMPLKYGRMTSGYTSRRLHPILKTYRPHYGVDYAAPRGTPILATADGTVKKATRGKGEGRYVVLRHANRYETMYMHMSRFAKGVRSGARVRQGQIIGYVGSTGFSTGPHVDYRMKIAGKYVNPRKTTLPPAPPLPEKEKGRFLSQQLLLAEALDSLCQGVTESQAVALNLSAESPAPSASAPSGI